MSRDLDLDRLADFIAGVLDGQDATEVAELVATDPVWSRAYAALVDADKAVRTQLRAWTDAMPQRMPADVAGRIDAALAAVHRPHTAPVRSLSVARQRRRHALVAAAAAVVVGVVGLGVASQVLPGLRGFASTEAAEAPQPVRGEGAAEPDDSVGTPHNTVTVMSSGTNYTASTLRQLVGAGVRATPDRAGKSTRSPAGVEAPALPAEDDPLARLRDPAELKSCLDAIRAQQLGVPTLIDYARYEGAPALVVVLRQGAGASTVVVAGPDCGRKGADDRTAIRVP